MSELHANYKTIPEFLAMFNDIAVEHLQTNAGWDMARRHHPEDLVAQLTTVMETMGLVMGYSIMESVQGKKQ